MISQNDNSNEENLNDEFLLKKESSSLQYSLENIEVDNFFISEKSEKTEKENEETKEKSINDSYNNMQISSEININENKENSTINSNSNFNNFLKAINKDNYSPLSSLQKIIQENKCEKEKEKEKNNITAKDKDKEKEKEKNLNKNEQINFNLNFDEINKIKTRKTSTISINNNNNNISQKINLENFNNINDSTVGDFDREISSMHSFSNQSNMDTDIKILKKKNKYLFEKNKIKIPEKILKDPSSNYNFYSRQFIPKNTKKSEKFKNSVPFLKEFNPKFLKKENIDKKILRKFRNFVKYFTENKNANAPKSLLKLKTKEINLSEKEEYILQNSNENKFIVEFYKENLLPPMNYSNEENNVTIQFKSFNTNYMLWLFSQKNMSEIYNLFAENMGTEILNEFIESYNLEKIDQSKEIGIINLLKDYILSIGKIYKSDKKIKMQLKKNEILKKDEEINENEIEIEENKDINMDIDFEKDIGNKIIIQNISIKEKEKNLNIIKMEVEPEEKIKMKTLNKKKIKYSHEIFDGIEDINITNQAMILDFYNIKKEENTKNNYFDDYFYSYNKNGRNINRNYFNEENEI